MPKFLRMSNFFSIFARFFILESAMGYVVFIWKSVIMSR